MLFTLLQPEKNSQPPSRLFRVKTTDSIMAGNWDEPNRPVEAGTVLTVDAERLSEIHGSVELLGELGPDGQLLPKKPSLAQALRIERKPAPPEWADLPPSFSTAAVMLNEQDCLRTELRLANAEVRAAGFTRDDERAARADRNRDRARDAFHAFTQDKLTRACVEASRITLHAIRKANLAREKLHATAFEVFSCRIAALELAEQKRRQLFGGSGTWTKYILPTDNPLYEGATIVWPGGDVIDESLEYLVHRYRRAIERQTEVERLQALADAELSAALAPVETPTKRK